MNYNKSVTNYYYYYYYYYGVTLQNLSIDSQLQDPRPHQPCWMVWAVQLLLHGIQ